MSNTSVPSKRPLTKQERSAVFAQYNRERHRTEGKRADRALGLVQSGDRRPYETRPDFCSCPDWLHRMQYVEGGRCKHQIRLGFAQAAAAAKETQPDEEQEREPSPESTTDEEPAGPENAQDKGDGDRMTIDEINELLYGR